jgi:hypothetical protein
MGLLMLHCDGSLSDLDHYGIDLLVRRQDDTLFAFGAEASCTLNSIVFQTRSSSEKHGFWHADAVSRRQGSRVLHHSIDGLVPLQ